MRLTMKPGVSAQRTGCFPQAAAVSYAVVAAASSVAKPLITSTRGAAARG